MLRRFTPCTATVHMATPFTIAQHVHVWVAAILAHSAAQRTLCLQQSCSDHGTNRVLETVAGLLQEPQGA
eukprot:10625246-Lingulodinium_polyedra.AAC.1